MRISTRRTYDGAVHAHIESTSWFTQRDIARRFPRAPEVVKQSLCYRIADR